MLQGLCTSILAIASSYRAPSMFGPEIFIRRGTVDTRQCLDCQGTKGARSQNLRDSCPSRELSHHFHLHHQKPLLQMNLVLRYAWTGRVHSRLRWDISLEAKVSYEADSLVTPWSRRYPILGISKALLESPNQSLNGSRDHDFTFEDAMACRHDRLRP